MVEPGLCGRSRRPVQWSVLGVVAAKREAPGDVDVVGEPLLAGGKGRAARNELRAQPLTSIRTASSAASIETFLSGSIRWVTVGGVR